MRFFFLPEHPGRHDGPWTAPRVLVQHLKALRVPPEEEFLLLPPSGEACQARWPGREQLELAGPRPRPTLPLRPVQLFTAWPKGPRADALVERAAEAGVARIQPVVFERSISGREPFRPNRLERWRRIALETCQQCRNPAPPQLAEAPLGLEQALEAADEAGPLLLQPGAPPLLDQLPAPEQPLSLFIGPEGGLSPAELAGLQDRGLPRAGLLPMVLRIEAAGPLAAAIAQLGPAS